MADKDVNLSIGADGSQASAEFEKISSNAQTAATRIEASMRAATIKMSDAFKESTKQMKESIEGFQSAFEKVNVAMMAFAGVMAGGKVFKEAIDSSIGLTKEAMSLGKALGISATQASILKVAMGDTYISQDTMMAANARLTKTLGANEGAFKSLGVATRDSNGNFRSTLDIMLDTNKALLKFKEGIDRNIEGQKIYGKSWGEVAGILKLNSDLMGEAEKKARALGLIVGQENVEATVKYRAAMNEMHDVFKAINKTIGDALVPILTRLGQWFADVGPGMVSIFKDVITSLGNILANLGDIIMELWTVFADAFSAIGQLFNDLGGTTLTFSEFFRNVLKIIETAIIGFKTSFQLAVATIKFLLAELVSALINGANVANRAMHLDAAGAIAAWKSGFSEMKSIAGEHWKDMVDIATKSQDEINKVMLGDNSTFKASSAPKGTGRSDGKDKKEHPSSRMSEWKSELEQQLESERQFFKTSLDEELQFWREKLNLIKGNSKQAVQERIAVHHEIYALEKKQAQDQLAADLEDIKARSAEYKAGSLERIELAGQAAIKIGEKYGIESKEYKAALKDMQQAAREHSAELVKIDEEQIRLEGKQKLQALEYDKLNIDLKKQLGQMSATDELVALADLEDQKYQIELDSLQKTAALYNEQTDQYRQAMIKIQELAGQHAIALQKINNQIAIEQKNEWTKMMEPLTKSIETSVQGIVMGTTTLKKALSNIFQSILSEFIAMQTKRVVAWIAGEHAQTAATVAGVGARTAAEQDAAGTSILMQAGQIIKKIMNYAWETFAGIFSFLSGLMGPAAAGPAMAGAADVMAVTGAVAFAAQGYDIPAGINPLVQAHQKEMILPAEQADVIRSLAAGGGGGGATHVHIHALDGRSVADLFKHNPNILAPAMRRATRNFTPTSPTRSPLGRF